MMKYKIGTLVPDRVKGSSALMPPIEERLSTVKAYLKALRAMNRRLITEVRDGILPAYRADRLTTDVDQHTFQNLKALAAALARITGQTVERILQLESVAHTETFIRDARRALGLDLVAIVRQEDLDEYLRRAVARNTSLITSLSDDMVKRVEQTVIANEVNGRSVADLKRALVEQFKIVDSRAELIAVDQTAKLNSDMNKIRQQQAGISEYEWMTAGDERVRQLHQGLNGKHYDWNERTGAEGGLPPGQPVRCRCVARAVVKF